MCGRPRRRPCRCELRIGRIYQLRWRVVYVRVPAHALRASVPRTLRSCVVRWFGCSLGTAYMQMYT